MWITNHDNNKCQIANPTQQTTTGTSAVTGVGCSGEDRASLIGGKGQLPVCVEVCITGVFGVGLSR